MCISLLWFWMPWIYLLHLTIFSHSKTAPVIHKISISQLDELCFLYNNHMSDIFINTLIKHVNIYLFPSCITWLVSSILPLSWSTLPPLACHLTTATHFEPMLIYQQLPSVAFTFGKVIGNTQHIDYSNGFEYCTFNRFQCSKLSNVESEIQKLHDSIDTGQ